MYKVYFENRSIVVSSQIPIPEEKSQIVIYNPKVHPHISKLPQMFENDPTIKQLYIQCANEDQAFKELVSSLEKVSAGGGLVTNKTGEILLIFRHGMWDLPKGKQEIDEDIRDTALREVKEECGVSNLDLKSKICTTYHTYRMDGEFIVKSTHWYHMEYEGNGYTKPQIEENIEKVEWIKVQDVASQLKGSFDTVKSVVYQFISGQH